MAQWEEEHLYKSERSYFGLKSFAQFHEKEERVRIAHTKEDRIDCTKVVYGLCYVLCWKEKTIERYKSCVLRSCADRLEY